jgi:hypothetical protein
MFQNENPDKRLYKNYYGLDLIRICKLIQLKQQMDKTFEYNDFGNHYISLKINLFSLPLIKPEPIKTLGAVKRLVI